jgi:hypothetical protein
LCGSLVIGSQIRLDFLQMVESIGEGIVYVRRAEIGIMLHDLFHGHALAVAQHNQAYSNASSANDRSSPLRLGVFSILR